MSGILDVEAMVHVYSLHAAAYPVSDYRKFLAKKEEV